MKCIYKKYKKQILIQQNKYIIYKVLFISINIIIEKLYYFSFVFKIYKRIHMSIVLLVSFQFAFKQ